MPVAPPTPVFVDATGRRRRLLGRLAYGFGGFCIVYGGLVGISLSGGPIEPNALLPFPDLVDRPSPDAARPVRQQVPTAEPRRDAAALAAADAARRDVGSWRPPASFGAAGSTTGQRRTAVGRSGGPDGPGAATPAPPGPSRSPVTESSRAPGGTGSAPTPSPTPSCPPTGTPAPAASPSVAPPVVPGGLDAGRTGGSTGGGSAGAGSAGAGSAGGGSTAGGPVGGGSVDGRSADDGAATAGGPDRTTGSQSADTAAPITAGQSGDGAAGPVAESVQRSARATGAVQPAGLWVQPAGLWVQPADVGGAEAAGPENWAADGTVAEPVGDGAVTVDDPAAASAETDVPPAFGAVPPAYGAVPPAYPVAANP